MKRFGPHAITNRSIEHRDVDMLAALDPIDIFYSDPPWGDGNLRYWATMNKKMTGQVVQPLTYDQLLARIFDLIDRHVRGHIFIETGLRWADDLADAMRDRYHHVQVFTLKYQSGSRMLENALVTAGSTAAHTYRFNPTGLSGYRAVKSALQPVARPGAVIFDPCCGMGYTAQAALELGMVFRGNELNAKRLAKTERRLMAAKEKGLAP